MCSETAVLRHKITSLRSPHRLSLSPTHPAPFHFVMLPTLDGEWVDREAGRMGLGKVRQEKQEGGEGEKKRLRLVPAQRVRGAD